MVTVGKSRKPTEKQFISSAFSLTNSKLDKFKDCLQIVSFQLAVDRLFSQTESKSLSLILVFLAFVLSAQVVGQMKIIVEFSVAPSRRRYSKNPA